MFGRTLVLFASLSLVAASPGGDGGRAGARVDAAGAAQDVAGPVLVSAAASLTEAFGRIGKAFEAAHPQAHVVLNLGASSMLRTQILEGAPVDVFASADTTNMAPVVAAGRVDGTPRMFAQNLLQIAVPRRNPGKVQGLADFSRAKLLIGLCARQVPCGVYARQALARAGVVPRVDTEEPDVRALLTKIELGELDAGITYVTDVTSTHGRVQGIDIPLAQNVVAAYPIAVLTRAPNPRAASAFVAFVLSDAGQGILRSYGFRAP